MTTVQQHATSLDLKLIIKVNASAIIELYQPVFSAQFVCVCVCVCVYIYRAFLEMIEKEIN
jgi:hypothetical protein